MKGPEKEPNSLFQELVADAVEAAEGLPAALAMLRERSSKGTIKRRLAEVRGTLGRILSALDHIEESLPLGPFSPQKSTPRKKPSKEALFVLEHTEFVKAMDDVQEFLGPQGGMEIPAERVLKLMGKNTPLFPDKPPADS
jgi:hypothetical protein